MAVGVSNRGFAWAPGKAPESALEAVELLAEMFDSGKGILTLAEASTSRAEAKKLHDWADELRDPAVGAPLDVETLTKMLREVLDEALVSVTNQSAPTTDNPLSAEAVAKGLMERIKAHAKPDPFQT